MKRMLTQLAPPPHITKPIENLLIAHTFQNRVNFTRNFPNLRKNLEWSTTRKLRSRNRNLHLKISKHKLLIVTDIENLIYFAKFHHGMYSEADTYREWEIKSDKSNWRIVKNSQAVTDPILRRNKHKSPARATTKRLRQSSRALPRPARTWMYLP